MKVAVSNSVHSSQKPLTRYTVNRLTSLRSISFCLNRLTGKQVNWLIVCPFMKLNAVAVTSTDLPKTVNFYTLLGFHFPPFKPDEQHLEPVTPDGSARLMIDTKELMRTLIGEEPQPGNHSSFAIEYDKPQEIDEVVQKLKTAGFAVEKEPWDAFWGQHYAVVKDPDGYQVDLYAQL